MNKQSFCKLKTSQAPNKKINLLDYGKARGAVYLKKYLPNLTPFTDISLVNNLKEWQQIKDSFNEHSFIRPDTLIGDKMVRLEGSDGMLSSVPKMIEEMKEQNPNSALLIVKTKNTQIPRYMDNGGFVVLFEIPNKIIIEFVGQGFDGRELTHGKAVHESFDIPWNKVLYIKNKNDLRKYSEIKKFIVNQEEYEKSREERINFLMKRCNYSRNILEENIPTKYLPVNEDIIKQVLDNIILELYIKQKQLLEDNLNYFCIQGNIINNKLEPWELFTIDRLIQK